MSCSRSTDSNRAGSPTTPGAGTGVYRSLVVLAVLLALLVALKVGTSLLGSDSKPVRPGVPLPSAGASAPHTYGPPVWPPTR